ncbi:MAG: flavin reductase family protein [Gemmatimonadota bacterium]|nr:flavin reductase family protein [Gemmatimonadota bacterium]
MTAIRDDFKRAMGHLASGVVIVTTRDSAGEPRGMTATAVCSVSLEPPLVMACMGHESATHRAVESSGVFAINVLPAAARELAGRFSSRSDDKFADVRLTKGESGAPLLAVALAHCDCRVEQSVAAGDHTIFIGRVLSVHAPDEPNGPLIYFRGAYGSVAPVDADDRDRRGT